MPGAVEAIAERVQAGLPILEPDLAVLAGTDDILTLGMLGDDARRRRHGADTTFVRVADVRLPLGDGAAFEPHPNAAEVRVSGPAVAFDSLLPLVRRVVDAAGRTPVSAFALDDLEAFAAASGRPLAGLLAALCDAGVSAVASAALDQMQAPEAALEAVKAAGLDLARLVVRHTAGTSDRLAHCLRARALQASLGWIRSFAPLGQTWTPGSPSTGFDDVRQVALARLVVDNVGSIQVDWSTYGPKLAQVALTVGADDLDAVSPLDDTGEGLRRGPLEVVRRNITAAGLAPVERDGAWRRVSR